MSVTEQYKSIFHTKSEMSNFNFEPSQWHKGKRSHEKMIVEGTKEKIEKI